MAFARLFLAALAVGHAAAGPVVPRFEGDVVIPAFGGEIKIAGNTSVSADDAFIRHSQNARTDPYHYADLGSSAHDAIVSASQQVQRFRRDLEARLFNDKRADSSSSGPVATKATSAKATKNPKYVGNPKWKSGSPGAPAPSSSSGSGSSSSGCYPSSSMSLPSTPATASSLQSWWCPQSSEYAFMGFSYPVDSCQSYDQLVSDFQLMKSKYGARYVRIYAACDNNGFQDDLVNAAWQAGLGIYGLIWFGWDDPNAYKGRMATLVSTIKNNPKAPYVIRNIAVGSEPLYDYALDPSTLAATILNLKSQLSQYGMQITISEMPWGYQVRDMAWDVLSAIDIVEGNILPFFDSNASYGSNAWGVFQWSVGFFQQNAPGKLIRATQTGWPSNQDVWKANSPNAVASDDSEKAYYDLLDSQCSSFFKPNSVGWFAHTFSDNGLPGWGVLSSSNSPKFAFNPRSTC